MRSLFYEAEVSRGLLDRSTSSDLHACAWVLIERLSPDVRIKISCKAHNRRVHALCDQRGDGLRVVGKSAVAFGGQDRRQILGKLIRLAFGICPGWLCDQDGENDKALHALKRMTGGRFRQSVCSLLAHSHDCVINRLGRVLSALSQERGYRVIKAVGLRRL